MLLDPGLVSRHPRHVALAALVAGLTLSSAPGLGIGIAVIVAALVRAVARRPVLGLAAGALLAVGVWIGIARVDAIDRSRLGPLVGHAVSVRGHVVKRERAVGGSERFRMRSVAVAAPELLRQARPVNDLVLVTARRNLRRPALEIGDEVTVEGHLERLRGRRDGDFDYAGYLRRAGVHALLEADTVASTGRRRGGATGVVDELRRNAEAGVGAGLSPGLAALARGMVLGEDERISRAMSDDFKASGLAHLLAVSGQNVTLLAILSLPVLAGLGLGRRGRLIAVLALIVVYVPLTGAGPSILRAGAMGAAGTVAMLAGRPASRWYGVLLAAAFTLVLDPRAWLDAGWQLSFAAVGGIFVLAPRLRTWFATLPHVLAEGAAVTLSATLATYPLMAFHFGRVSLVSVLANLVALPVVAPIMWSGMLAATAGQLWLAPAALLNAINELCLAYLASVAQWSAGLPNAVLALQIESPLALLAAYVGPIAAFAGGRRASRALATRVGARRFAPAAAVALFAVAVLGALALHSDRNAPSRFTISFLDVGQGDATLLQTPSKDTVLIDGGPAGDHLIGKLRKAGVRSLAVVVLTHPQADHEDGLLPVLEKLPVRLLLDGGAGSQIEMHRRIVAVAREHGTHVRAGRAGDTFTVGALRLRVLSPDPAAVSATDDPNDRAIVLLASYRGLDLFLPADAESNVTLGLPPVRAEILKVAHHGSADEGLPALLDRVRPRIAVIEVGADNPYGHPTDETLTSLRRVVSSVFRTDRDGDVRISMNSDGRLAIASQH